MSQGDGRPVTHGGEFRRVLVGYDGSEKAKDALRAGLALVEELGGDLRVLLIVRPPAHAETPEELREAEAAERRNLSRGLLDQGETGRDVDTKVVFADDPGRALADHAEEYGFDIVVVGDHGRDHATHRGIGRSLEALLRRHPCPVLVI